MIIDGKITHAAHVLFGKNLSRDYPQCLLRIGRFEGISKIDPFIDERHIWGNAFDQLEEAMKFLKRHIPVSYTFSPDRLERISQPLIPYEALREALVNAICHRDYSNDGCSIEVGMYNNRIEIWSPGLLPEGMTFEMLMRQHPSIPRNKTVAQAFFRRGLIEKWGMGTLKILQYCKEAKQQEPIFSTSGSYTVLTFPMVLKGSNRVVESAQSLTGRQRQILLFLSNQNEVSLKEVKQHLRDVPSRTIQRDLQILKKLQILAHEGVGVNSRWKIKEK